MNQTAIWYESEGAAWLKRNKDKMAPKDDIVMKVIDDCKIKPKNVLEFGCADGWRLKRLRKKFGCNVTGIDPAASQFTKPGIRLVVGDCANPGLRIYQEYDLVIYGFCLYACDREDLFMIAQIGDSLLVDGGHIIVHDFENTPQKRKYKHDKRVSIYKMQHHKLWTWNPAYSVHRHIEAGGNWDVATSAVAVKKNLKDAWPQR